MDPSIVAGATAVIDVDEFTATLEADSTTLSLVGALPDSSTKLTVAPVTNPVPVIVTDVPPLIEPDAGLIPVTVGTVGDHNQLSVIMPVPQ